jgi:flagellar biogenesis protein FliO
MGGTALAANSGLSVTLKQVQASGSQIDLLFDGKVTKNQIRTEFFNDVIQLSLNDVSVYPAKISSVNGGNLVKIFAYQYAPRLVRCRLTVKGKAEDYKNRLQLVSNGAGGKLLTIRIADTGAKIASDQITLSEAAPVKAEAPAAVTPAPRNILSEPDPGKAALLERLSNKGSDKPTEKAADKSASTKNEEALSDEGRSSKKSLSLAGGKPLPSPLGVMGKLAAVIGLFGVVALILKRFSGGMSTMRGQQSSKILGARLNAEVRSGARQGKGWMGAFGNIVQAASQGLKPREKMIEVVSNHYLGPKKSIAVVKIMGRTLVLGVTNESINLITQIDDEEGFDQLDDNSPISDAILGALTENKAASPVARTAAPAAAKAPAPVAAKPVERAINYGQSSTQAGFESLLRAETNRPAALNSPAAAVLAQAPTGSSVRSQIRSRLEGLKQL